MVYGRQYDAWNHTAQICTIFQTTMSSKKVSSGEVRSMFRSLHPLMAKKKSLPKADISVLKSLFIDKDVAKGLAVGNKT